MKKIFLLTTVILFLLFANSASAHLPRITYSQDGAVEIINPEISQAFYDELKGQPRDYFIESSVDFELYLNLLVPEIANIDGRYSAKVFATSVLPTPVGPKNKNEPIGRR